eukprot:3799628-Rhodomonas_salina.1
MIPTVLLAPTPEDVVGVSTDKMSASTAWENTNVNARHRRYHNEEDDIADAIDIQTRGTAPCEATLPTLCSA